MKLLNCFSNHFYRFKRRRRLINKLNNLELQKSKYLENLGHSRQRVINNSRQSDRKFNENNRRAISSRIKKADMSKLRSLESIINRTEQKLKEIS